MAEHAERIGQRMRERRKELGLKQRQVADRMERISVDGNVVSRWERAINRPSDDHLELIAQALETTTADLIAGPHDGRVDQPTPDLFADGSAAGADDRLARIERKLDAVLAWAAVQPEPDGVIDSDALDVFRGALADLGLVPGQGRGAAASGEGASGRRPKAGGADGG